MTQSTQRTAESPVCSGFFPDGPDSLLWNPHLPEDLWRREQLRALTRIGPVLCGLSGAGFAALGVWGASGFSGAMMIGVGVLAVAAGALGAWINLSDLATEHHHAPGHECRLEREPGEFFFRARDFQPCGQPAYDTVRALIAAVDELHRTPARHWLEPGLPDEVHRAVWEALCCLHRTKDARALADELTAVPDAGDLADAARQAVQTIDDDLAGVARHVRGCVVLTQAWEAKLRRTDLADRTEHALAAMAESGIQQSADAAEVLPQKVFAYLTAARDVTDAGEFPWEAPTPETRVGSGDTP